ncbi:MAG: TonB-dependent receptor, partial [Bacteroidota bacterium]
MKCLSILTILTLFCAQLTAQVSLTGKTVDESDAPIAYANVLLLQRTDSTLVRGAISEDEGTFVIEQCPVGSYLLKVSFLGYEDYYQSITLETSLDLGKLQLLASSAQLADVTVTAKKPLYQLALDRLTINVQANISTAGGTALEVLERSPGVIVDRARNILSMAGRDGVVITINGRMARQPIEALLQMLDGMNADNVERIELISNPPARFEAGGNGGVINIVLVKRADDGTNGAFSATLGYGPGGDKQGASFNINHRKGAWNWFANLSLNRNNQEQTFTNDRTVEEESVPFVTRSVSERDPVTANGDLRAGVDVSLGKNTTLGALLTASINEWNMDALNKGFIQEGTERTNFSIANQELSRWRSLGGNLNLTHQFKRSTITADLERLHYRQSNPVDYQVEERNANEQLLSTEAINATKETPVNIWVSRVDFEDPITEHIKLKLGAKGIFSNLQNTVTNNFGSNGLFQVEDGLNQDATLDENITAAYVSADFKLSTKTDLSLGLRYEYTDLELNNSDGSSILDLDYGNFFPTAFLSHQFSESFSGQLSYGRRINRPTFGNLAPFVIFLDPTTYFFGNIALQPSFGNNYKIDFIYRQYLLSFQYNDEHDAISNFQPTLLPGTNQQVFTALNLDFQRSFTIMIGGPIKLADWCNLQVNLMGRQRSL